MGSRGKVLARIMVVSLATMSGTAQAQSSVGPPNVLDLALGGYFSHGVGNYWGGFHQGERPLFQPLSMQDQEGHDIYQARLAVDYSTPLPGLAVNLSLPFQAVKAHSDPNWGWRPGSVCEVPSSGPASWAQGCDYRARDGWMVTDLSGSVRYMLTEPYTRVRVVPRIGFSFPLKDYPIIGYTSYGGGVKSVTFGLDMGRDLGPLLGGAFVNLGYSFTAVDSLLDRIERDVAKNKLPPGPHEMDDLLEDAEEASNAYLRPHYSLAYVQFGYAITPELTATIRMDGRITHAGFNCSSWDEMTEHPELFDYYHIALAKTNLIWGSIAASYMITDWLGVYVGGFHSFAGSSSHEVTGFELGVTSSILLPGAGGLDNDLEMELAEESAPLDTDSEGQQL